MHKEIILWLGGDRASEAVVMDPDSSYKWIHGFAPSYSLDSRISEEKAILDVLVYLKHIESCRKLSESEQRLLNTAESEIEYLFYWHQYFGNKKV